MPNSTSRGPVFLSDVYDAAQELLEKYIFLDYVSADAEREYLKAFNQARKVLKQNFGSRANCIVMLADDFSPFRTLPLCLRLYRGYHEPEKREGISWSLSRKVADSFAYGMDGDKTEDARVVTGTCLLSRVLAYTNGGFEQEFIVDPRDVRDIRNIKVREKPEHLFTAEPLEELLKGRQHHGSEIMKAD